MFRIRERIRSIRNDMVMFSTINYVGMTIVYVLLGILIGCALAMMR
jgi:hypothetical protein